MRQRPAVPSVSRPATSPPVAAPAISSNNGSVNANKAISQRRSWLLAGVAIMAVVILTLIIIVLLLPSPTSPVAYTMASLPTFPSGSSLISLTSANVTQLAKGLLTAAEAVVFDKHGNLYAGCADGRIVRINARHLINLHSNGDEVVSLIAYTGDASRAEAAGLKCGSYAAEPICGRPLGMIVDDDHTLLVADAYYGLLSVDVIERTVRVLTSSISTYNGVHHPADDTIIIKDASLAAEYRSIKMNDSVAIRFANCVARGRDGYIYITDSSDR